MADLVLAVMVIGLGWMCLKRKVKMPECEPVKVDGGMYKINDVAYRIFSHIASYSDLRYGRASIGKNKNISYNDGYENVYFVQYNKDGIIDGSSLNLSAILGDDNGVLDGSTILFFDKIVAIINEGGRLVPIWTDEERRCIICGKNGLPFGEFEIIDNEIVFIDWSN